MKGILFKENLFNSVIRGDKTQTRRIAKPKLPKETELLAVFWGGDDKGIFADVHFHFENDVGEYLQTMRPRYQKNEKLYLKEPYHYEELIGYSYKYGVSPKEQMNVKFKNKLFMPEKAARYFIKITDIRLELLQDIDTEDIEAEGIHLLDENATDKDYSNAWKTLWDRINGKTVPYDSNPFVWVYEFELVDV